MFLFFPFPYIYMLLGESTKHRRSESGTLQTQTADSKSKSKSKHKQTTHDARRVAQKQKHAAYVQLRLRFLLTLVLYCTSTAMYFIATEGLACGTLHHPWHQLFTSPPHIKIETNWKLKFIMASSHCRRARRLLSGHQSAWIIKLKRN